MLSNKVSEIMTRDVVTAESSHTVFAVMELMAKRDVGAVVVTEKKLPVGIFTEQDVLKRVMTQKRDPKKNNVKSVMTAPIRAVAEDTHIVQALEKMHRLKFRHLLIRGAKGTMAGLVSIRDILKFAVNVGQGLAETRTIGDVVTGHYVSVSWDETIERTLEMMSRRNSGCVVVLRGEKPVGIFTERDVLKRVAISKISVSKTPVKEVMTRRVVAVHRTALIGEVLTEMHRRGFRNMPVSDEGEKLVGVVALPEILQYARGLDVDETIRKTWKEIEEFWESEEHYTPG